MLNHPKQVTEALILSYPKGLDIYDTRKKTPRDYFKNKNNEHLDIQALINRPVICWMKNLSDDANSKNMKDDLLVLEREVEDLINQVNITLEEEAKIENLFNQTCLIIDEFDISAKEKALMNRIDTVGKTIETEVQQITDNLLNSFEVTEIKYLDDERERQYIEAFNDDVIKIYTHAQEDIGEMREELNKIMAEMPTKS
mmetsp:Transcript_14661/g.20928  ORF Transcript_14661/g.20928 Transcript_14661/m.20928 type:complete len:199 (-) Transcript_14661:33-629(-)